MKSTTPTDVGGRCGNDRLEETGKSNITQLPAPQRLRPGILAYRQQRTPGEICAAIMRALDREARLARDTGVNTPPEILSDISAWIGRGCLP